MYNFLLTMCICFFTLQKETMADNCNTLQLEPNQPLLITIFDKNYEANINLMWHYVCEVIRKSPKGLISMEYRPGALANGTLKSIKCGSGDCGTDQIQGCRTLHYKFVNDCHQETQGGVKAFGDSIRCYCNQESNQFLLENAALRAKWNVPENAIPALAFNQKYNPCAETHTYESVKKEVCKIYNNKLDLCSSG